jgi:hypothetical protein
MPFYDKNGKSMRLWDIMGIDNVSNKVTFFEAKDFGRFYAYPLTGLPQRYIDKRMMLANNGESVYLIFRDNTVVAENIANRSWGRFTVDDILRRWGNDGFVKFGEPRVSIENNGCKIDMPSPYFMPYGNKLSFLMRPENRDTELETREVEDDNGNKKLLMASRFDKYVGEKQYLWKISAMLPIDKLLEQEFGIDVTMEVAK